MNSEAPGPPVDALGCRTRASHAGTARRLIWGAIFAASAILQACDQAPPGRGGESPRQRETQAEVERLRDFVDLLHREIEQLQKDKQRLTEEVERLQRDNAALRAGTAKPAAAERRAARPARGASPE